MTNCESPGRRQHTLISCLNLNGGCTRHYNSYFFTGFPAVFLGVDVGLTVAFTTALAAALLTGFAFAGTVLVTDLATVFVVALGFDLVAVAGLSLAFFDAAGFLLLSALLVAVATLWAMPGSLSKALLTACLN